MPEEVKVPPQPEQPKEYKEPLKKEDIEKFKGFDKEMQQAFQVFAQHCINEIGVQKEKQKQLNVMDEIKARGQKAAKRLYEAYKIPSENCQKDIDVNEGVIKYVIFPKQPVQPQPAQPEPPKEK